MDLKHKDTTINQTNHSSVYMVIKKKTAKPLVLISNYSRAPSQSQEQQTTLKVCLKGRIVSFAINTKSVVRCTNSFSLKGHADCFRRDLLSSLNQNGI